MKTCTGPRDSNEFLQMSLIDGWHGKFGHLNVKKMDHNSVITGFGKHNRVVAFCPNHEGLYCRVDRVWELRDPTEKEIIKVARTQGAKGKWQLSKKEEYDSYFLNNEGYGKSVEYHFVKTK